MPQSGNVISLDNLGRLSGEMVVDPNGEFGYASTDHATIVKIDLVNNAVISTTPQAVDNFGNTLDYVFDSAVMSHDGHFAYFSSTDVTRDIVLIKLNLQTFQYAAVINFSVTGDVLGRGVRITALDSADNWLLYSTNQDQTYFGAINVGQMTAGESIGPMSPATYSTGTYPISYPIGEFVPSVNKLVYMTNTTDSLLVQVDVDFSDPVAGPQFSTPDVIPMSGAGIVGNFADTSAFIPGLNGAGDIYFGTKADPADPITYPAQIIHFGISSGHLSSPDATPFTSKVADVLQMETMQSGAGLPSGLIIRSGNLGSEDTVSAYDPQAHVILVSQVTGSSLGFVVSGTYVYSVIDSVPTTIVRLNSGESLGASQSIGGINGVYARYQGASFDGTANTWHDTSGFGHDLVPGGSNTAGSLVNSGSLVQVSADSTGPYPTTFPVVQGTPADSITFPSPMLPDDNYTLFTVARYRAPNDSGGSYQRIFDSVTSNWFSGFWRAIAGITYHGGFTADPNQVPDVASESQWLISTDQTNVYRANGVDATGPGTGGGNPGTLAINNGLSSSGTSPTSEASNFQVADVIAFHRVLTAPEIIAVEHALQIQYGQVASGPTPTKPNTPTNLKVVSTGPGSYHVTWTAPFDNGIPYTAYNIQSKAIWDSSWSDNYASASDSSIDISTSANSEFEFRIAAVDEVTGNSSEFSQSVELQLVITSVADVPVSPSDLAQVLAGPGVTLTNVRVNGQATFDPIGDPAQDFTDRFGVFQGGRKDVGFSRGIVMSPANVHYFQRDRGFNNPNNKGDLNGIGNSDYQSLWNDFASYVANDALSTNKSGEFGPVCGGPCLHGAQFLQFDTMPDGKYLKFEYSIAGTETLAQNYLYDYPDGFGLFVNGISLATNCALIPEGAIAGATPQQRYLAAGNLNDGHLLNFPDASSSLRAASISTPLSCVADMSAFQGQNVTVTMAVANARDSVLSPAVFLAANSVRFDNLAIDQVIVPPAAMNRTYESTNTFFFTASGGQAPYSYAVTDPTQLPPGMSVTAAGQLVGTPTSAGNFAITLQVTDGASITSTQDFTISVSEFTAPQISLGASALYAFTGIAFTSTDISSSPGQAGTISTTPAPWITNTDGPITLFSVGGNLPAGLSLDPTTGVISGTPTGTTQGDTQLTITANGPGGNSTATFTLNVAPAAQMNGDGEAFLKGQFVEVGVGANGHFGTNGSAPQGFHPRPANCDGRCLGFMSDRARDGWYTGYTDGDFFVPGNPFEGFALDASGTSESNSNFRSDVQTSSSGVDSSDLENTVKSQWSGISNSGISLNQVTSVPRNGAQLDVSVTITNTTDSPVDNIYYARQVDPDNNQSINISSYECGFTTTNTVLAQAAHGDGISMVSATQPDTCRTDINQSLGTNGQTYLALYSTDSRSSAGTNIYAFGPEPAADWFANSSIDSCPPICSSGHLITLGTTLTRDSGIGLGFNVGLLNPGESTTVSFSYILSSAQADVLISQAATNAGLLPPAFSISSDHFTTFAESPFATPDGWTASVDPVVDPSVGPVSYYAMDSSTPLPAGLSLDPTTGAISGVATTTSVLPSYTIKAVNLAGVATHTFTLSVYRNPSDVMVRQTAGGPALTWTTDPNAVSYDIELADPNGIYGGTNGWATLDNVMTDASQPSQSYVIPGITMGIDYQVRVRAHYADNAISGWSLSNVFDYGLFGCDSNQDYHVVLLSRFEHPAHPNAFGTDPMGADARALNAVCPRFSVTVFSGGDGSLSAWQAALSGADAVIIPQSRTGQSLIGSDALSNDALDYLRQWGQRQGNIVLLGAASQQDMISQWTSGQFDSSIATSDTIDVYSAQNPKDSADGELVSHGVPGIAYSQSQIQSWHVTYSYSTFGRWVVGGAAIPAPGNDLARMNVLSYDWSDANADAGWNKALVSAVANSNWLNEPIQGRSNYWDIVGSGIVSGTSDTNSSPFAITPLGNLALTSSTNRLHGPAPTVIPVGCMDSYSDPRTTKRIVDQTGTLIGIQITCGWMPVNDGASAAVLFARVSRYVSILHPWARTTIELRNEGTETYTGAVNFTSVMASGDSTETLANSVTANHAVIVTGPGQAAMDGDGTQPSLVVTVSGQQPDLMNVNNALTTRQPGAVWMMSNVTVPVTQRQPGNTAATTLTYLTGLVNYVSGCGDKAAQNASIQVGDFVGAVDDAFNGQFTNDAMNQAPDMVADCGNPPVDAPIVSGEYVAQPNDALISWSGVTGAENYQTRVRILGSDWDTNPSHYVVGSDTSVDLSGLQPSQTYEVQTRGRHGSDQFGWANGPWSSTQTIVTSAATAPQTLSASAAVLLGAHLNDQGGVAHVTYAQSNDDSVTAYKLRVNCDCARDGQIVDINGRDGFYNVGDLVFDQTYTFSLAAFTNSTTVENANWLTTNSVTPHRYVMSAPTRVVVTPVVGLPSDTSGSVSVAFEAPLVESGDSITAYVVTVSPGGLQVLSLSSPVVVTGLALNRDYTFTVKALSAKSGTSLISSPISGRIPSVAKTVPTMPKIPTTIKPGTKATVALAGGLNANKLKTALKSKTPKICTVTLTKDKKKVVSGFSIAALKLANGKKSAVCVVAVTITGNATFANVTAQNVTIKIKK